MTDQQHLDCAEHVANLANLLKDNIKAYVQANLLLDKDFASNFAIINSGLAIVLGSELISLACAVLDPAGSDILVKKCLKSLEKAIKMRKDNITAKMQELVNDGLLKEIKVRDTIFKT